MWRLCKLGYRHEPRLMLGGVRAVAAGGAARRAARAVAQAARRRRARAPAARSCCGAAIGLGVSATAHVVPAHGQHARAAPLPRQGDDRARVARRAAAGVDRDHRAPGAARLSRSARDAARSGVRARPHVHVAVLDAAAGSCGSASRSRCCVDPPGARAARRVRAADRAHLDVAARRSSARRRSAARSRTGWRATCSRSRRRRRPARRCASPASASGWSRERRDGVGALVRAGRARRAGARPRGTRWRGRSSAPAYVGAVVFVVVRPRARRPATCCSCSPPARGCRRTSARRSARSASCAASGWTARGGSRGSRTTPRRSSRVGRSAGARRARAAASASSTCRSPIPAPIALVLDDVSLTLPAGAVVAIVGENGAGKTTLVKLLAKLYEPTSRRDPRRRRAAGAHARRRVARAAGRRVPGLLPLRVPRAADRRPRRRAAARRRAGGRRRRSIAPAPTTSSRGCRRGSTRSSARPGPTASRCRFGQWQKLALARGFMRDAPLLLVLDEPTAALDAETEHALFERYAAARARRRATDGRITILVSHRFSTVRMADLIVVLDGARARRGRHARGADGDGRAVRRAVRHPGGRVSNLVIVLRRRDVSACPRWRVLRGL